MGSVDVTSTGDVPFNCTYFQEYRNEGVIYNDYSCNGTVSASLSPSGGLSTGAKAGIGVGASLGGCVLIACIAAMVVYYRKRSRRNTAQGKDTGIVTKLLVEVEAKEI